MPMFIQAGLWGLLGGSARVVGAAIAYLACLPRRLIAAIMAFGSGVLISALSFDLMDEAFGLAGPGPAALGFVAGAGIYTAANICVSRRGGQHRKRSGGQQPDTAEDGGLAIAVGALLDGIPESLAAIFLSNLPESLPSAAGMRRDGRGAGYVFGVRGGIALASGLAALLGNVALAGAGPQIIAATTAVAAGAILAMLAGTMIPEAFAATHEYAGLITVGGFLTAFVLTKIGG